MNTQNIEWLSALYGKRFEAISLLHSGENDAYLLRSGAENFVLKVYREERTHRVSIEDELNLLRHLQRCGVRTVEVLMSLRGHEIEEFEERSMVLQKFCPGYMLHAPEAKDFENLGAKLRSLHQIDASSFMIGRHTFDSTIECNWRHIEEAPFLSKKTIQRLFEYKTHIFHHFHFEPQSIVHFDLHWGNMILQKEEIVFLDWEECGIGNRILELGAINAHLLRNPRGEVMREGLLQGYALEVDRRELNLATMVKLFQLLGHIPTKLDMVQLKNPEDIFDRYLGYFERLLDEWSKV